MHTRRIAGVLCFLTIVASCDRGATSEPPSVPDLGRAQIDQALSSTSDDFVHRALADYHVSDAENAEAQDLEMHCITDASKGLQVTFQDGQVSVEETPEFVAQYPDQSAADDATTRIMDSCTGPNLPSQLVQSIYVGMHQNPEGLTPSQMIRGCFDANGVSDGAGMSDAQLMDMVLDPSYVPSSAAASSCASDYLPPWDHRGGTSTTATPHDD